MAPQTIEDLLKAEATRIDALHGERRSHELVKFAIAAPAIAALEHRLAQSLEVTEAEIELVQKRFGAVAADFLRTVNAGAKVGARAGAKLGAVVGSIPGRAAALSGGAHGAVTGAVLGGAAGAAAGAAAHVAPAVARGSKALAGYYQKARAKVGDAGAALGEKAVVGGEAHRQAVRVGAGQAAATAALKVGHGPATAAVLRMTRGSRPAGFQSTPVSRHIDGSAIAGGARAGRELRGEAAAQGRRIATRAFDVGGGLTAAIAGGAAAYGAYRATKDGRAGRDGDGDGKKGEGKA